MIYFSGRFGLCKGLIVKGECSFLVPLHINRVKNKKIVLVRNCLEEQEILSVGNCLEEKEEKIGSVGNCLEEEKKEEDKEEEKELSQEGEKEEKDEDKEGALITLLGNSSTKASHILLEAKHSTKLMV